MAAAAVVTDDNEDASNKLGALMRVLRALIIMRLRSDTLIVINPTNYRFCVH